MMATHQLKTLPEYFVPVFLRRKSFEIRWNDRAFKEHDFLELREWNGENYTGRVCWRTVTYVLSHNEFPGIAPGYVVMAIT